jgi:magnesium chelatase accessory protein
VLDGLYPPLQAEELGADWPHMECSRFVQTPGVRWHVQIAGSGPVLLLLHGAGASTHTWRDLLPTLRADFTVVCPDLPGHALSHIAPGWRPGLREMADALDHLLRALGLQPQVVVGHSAGGAVAAQWVLDHPSQTPAGSPIVVGLNPAWLPIPGMASWMFPVAAKVLALNPLSALWIARHGKRPEVVKKLVDETGSWLNAQGVDYYARLIRQPAHVRGVLAMMAAWDMGALGRRMPELRGPVFMHLGGRDTTVPTSWSGRTYGILPQARGITVPELGHLAHEEAPELVARQIGAWALESLSQTAR